MLSENMPLYVLKASAGIFVIGFTIAFPAMMFHFKEKIISALKVVAKFMGL